MDNKVKEGGLVKEEEEEGKKGHFQRSLPFPPPNQEQEKERKIINHCLLLFSLSATCLKVAVVLGSRVRKREKDKIDCPLRHGSHCRN